MTLNEAQDWIKKQTFVYAKSYAQTLPHYYTTRSRCDEATFEEFLWVIRDFGIVKSFYDKQYVYLELNGYEYWEMGRPIAAVQVLNRATINDEAKYRFPKPTPMQSNQLKATLLKREIEVRCLIEKQDKTQQEKSMLQFALNSERRIHGGGKNIIDNAKINIRYE
jgi:hypothetical protein